MKRFLLVVLGLLAVPCFAANNIKMVTYFPVPYAAYSDLSVDGTCDVGLLGSCSLDAGTALNVSKKASDSRALNTGSFIVRSGTLNLQSTNSSPILSTAYLTAGNGSATVGSLNFSHDLAVSQINNSTAQSMTAQNKAILTRLQIFGHTFPTCDATDHKISWQRLTMGGSAGIFLVCGEGTAYECPPPSGESTTQACPSGYYGTQTRTWNTESCSWNSWNTSGCTPIQLRWPANATTGERISGRWSCSSYPNIPYCSQYEGKTCSSAGQTMECFTGGSQNYCWKYIITCQEYKG